jgi:DUF4097 and DUF4098 domain-containing protein YvlB
MISLAAALLAAGMLQAADTTFQVQPGARLSVDMMSGSVTVRTWDRASMRVVTSGSGAGRLNVIRRGDNIRLESQRSGFHPPNQNVRYEVMVPRSFSVSLDGIRMDASVDGVHGDVSISNVEGAISIAAVTGSVEVESVNGAVTVSSVHGSVSVETVNQAVRLSGVRGDVSAETVNGGIHMQGIDSRQVTASTVAGIVEYSGAIVDGGRYALATHNGRITLAVPEGANATMIITTRNGQVDAAFPVRVSGTSGSTVTTRFGNGSARVELESFNGTVRLIRP